MPDQFEVHPTRKVTLLPVIGGPLHNTEVEDRGQEFEKILGTHRYLYGRAKVTVEAPCVFRGVRGIFTTVEDGYRLIATQVVETPEEVG
ncbi:MAG: hypothetical protein AB7P61_16045, partial [Gemmatimonadales bacterium]